MRRLAWLVVAVLVCGTSWGVDYQWTAGAAAFWDCGTNWSGGVGTDWPDDAGDRAYIGNGITANVLSAGSTITVGELYVAYGSNIVQNKNMTFIVDDSGGKSGDWWWVSTANFTDWGISSIFDIDGNFYHMSDYSFGYGGYKQLIKMRGNDKAIKHTAQAWSSNVCYEIYGQRVWDNGSPGTATFTPAYVNVMPGGSIGSNAAVTGTWTARSYGFPDGQANLPALKEKVDFRYGWVIGSDNVPGQLAITGGVTYPQDVTFNGDWMGGVGATFTPEYEFKLKPYAPSQSADLGVGRDLKISGGTYSYQKIYVNTLENGTNNSAALTVKRNLVVADIYWYDYNTQTNHQFQGVRLNNSQVNVGGNFVVGAGDGAWDGWFPRNSGAIDLGNATINVGGNFTVYRMNQNARLLWNRNNNSTMVFDGNGTTATQTIRIYGDDGMGANEHTPLHNVVVNTLGTVRLDPFTWGGMATGPAQGYWVNQDNAFRNTVLVLTGDLDIECGTFLQNNRTIMFNGPEHNWTNKTASKFDNIVLLPNAVVILGSNIIMDCETFDNLTLMSGAKLYLNGFNLFAEGAWYNDGDAPSWVYDQGLILSGGLAIPEPATVFLIGTGVLTFMGHLRRRRMK